jgi:hypothetical protein
MAGERRDDDIGASRAGRVRPRFVIAPALWLCRVSRGGAVWRWMALAVIGGCRPTVPGGVDSLVF